MSTLLCKKAFFQEGERRGRGGVIESLGIDEYSIPGTYAVDPIGTFTTYSVPSAVVTTNILLCFTNRHASALRW